MKKIFPLLIILMLSLAPTSLMAQPPDPPEDPGTGGGPVGGGAPLGEGMVIMLVAAAGYGGVKSKVGKPKSRRAEEPKGGGD